MAEQDIHPPTITAMKIPIIRKGEYDIWSMRMQQYIYHTDHNLWDVIVNGNLEEEPASTGDQSGPSAPPAPKTAKQLAARRNQERVKSILLLAILDEYLLKFHNVADAKSLWEAIKSRFGGNVESKKMQKNVLKHQFENFSTASNESLDKAYDRFQKLISQLEVHGAPISKEDINQKFLRSLPSSWNQIALIMRNKPDIDEIDIDDLYNNLRVYEDELKRSSGSNSASQNLAFLSSENTGGTNEVSTASGDFGVSTAGGINQVPSTPCAHDVAYSFLAQPTTSPQLENEDFQQMDGDDLEELDLRWQVAMLTVRVKKLSATTVTEKGTLLENVDLEGIKEEDLMVTMAGAMHQQMNLHHKALSGRSQGRRSYGENGRSNAQTNESSSQALVAQDGLGGYDWSNDFEVEPVNYSLMAISSSSSSSSSNSEVQQYSKCLKSFKYHQKNYDTEREKHNKAKLEIRGYEIAIESLESRIKKAIKERDELKDKIAKWEESTKNLEEILKSQMSARDKTSLGYSSVIIEDWTSDDEEEVFGVQNVRPDTRDVKSGQNSHKQGVGTARPSISTARPSVSTARPVSTVRPSISTARHVYTARPSISTVRPVYASRSIYPRMDNVRPRGSCSPIKRSYYTKPAFRPKDLKQDVKTFRVKNMTTAGKRAVVNTGKGKLDTDLKKSRWVWRPKGNYLDHVSKDSGSFMLKKGNPEILLQDHAVVDSGCSIHMTGNKAYLSDYEDYNRGFVAFGSDPKGGKITGKGKIKTANLDFDDVYFVDELKFNLFSVSQMCDKKNSVLFTESECLILSPSFKLLDESQVVLRAPRKDDVYSLDLKNIVPSGGITCLYANATADESKLWHRRLGHVNFKNINKLVKGHLVRGLPSKVFVNDHTCVACKKGKQHKASCKAKLERIIRKPLELLHMDLFGPVSVESINKKRYCLVVTDDFSRFSWVFFLATKDETSEILCKFIIGLENQLNHNVKIIRCDNGTEFKNHAMNEFCAKKGIKREFSVARTPQQNGVAERKNRTLIEAARTMLADSLLPIPFWAEAVNTACYVLNRVLVTKPQNKTPYELLIGNSPSISFMRPFGCPLTILNTLDSLGKFDGKSDEGYLLGYSTTSKAFRVYNKRTKRVEENLHIDFLEDQPNVAGTGPNWMFDLDFLTNSMNYIPVSVENQVNVDAGTQDSYVAGSSGKDKGPTQEYILLPLQPHRTRIPVEDVAPAAHEKPSESSPKDNDVQDSEDVADKEGQHQMTEDEQVLHDELEKMIAQEVVAKALDDATRQAFEEEKRNIASQKRAAQAISTNKLSTDRSSVSTDRPFVSTDRSSVSTANTPYVSAASTSTGANAGESSFVYLRGKIPIDASTLHNADLPIDPNMPDLKETSDTFLDGGIFNGAYDDDEDVGAVADFNNIDNTIVVSPILTLIIHKDHPKGQILGDLTSSVQTRGKIQKASSAQQALVEAMQEELLQFKLQKVWILVDLPSGKKAIGIKWVFKNKRDKRSIVVKNKARLIAHGFRQEEGIDCDEVFAPVARIEAISLFLAFASIMGFTSTMDVKECSFSNGTNEEECRSINLSFVDPAHLNKVYKVIKALYGLHQAPRAWYETLSSFLMENGFRRGTIDKTLFIKKNKSDIMLVQVYVDDIIFGSTKKYMCTEFEDCMHKRFQMSSMGELTFFLGLQVKQQPDGIFISQDKYVADILKKFDFWSIRTATTPIESNKPLVKDEDGEDVDVHVYRSMIGSLMYLTASRPDIMFAVCACARFPSLWYLRDSPFELEAFSDSDYGGASLNGKSTTGVVTPLFESMLVQAHDEEQQQSPSRITSTPSLSQQPTPSSPSPEPIQPTHEAEETASMPHDSPLHDVHSHGSAEGSVQQHDLTILVSKLNDQIDGLEKDLQQTKKTYSTALTKLVLRVKKLEYKLKSGKARRKAKIVLSDDEEIAEDSSKQGRKISQIDEDPTISLVQDEGISWIPQEEEVHEKPSDETEVLGIRKRLPQKVIEEHEVVEKGRWKKKKESSLMKTGSKSFASQKRRRLNLEAIGNCKDNLIKDK
ncbi:putative ribonuclease H-like domain-containing protein [Tanacetum coccineum]